MFDISYLLVFNLRGRHAGHDPQEKVAKKEIRKCGSRGKSGERSFSLWKSFVRRFHSHLNLLYISEKY